MSETLWVSPGSQAGDAGWEDSLEEEMAIHSIILTCEIPWTEEPSGLQSMLPATPVWPTWSLSRLGEQQDRPSGQTACSPFSLTSRVPVLGFTVHDPPQQDG